MTEQKEMFTAEQMAEARKEYDRIVEALERDKTLLREALERAVENARYAGLDQEDVEYAWRDVFDEINWDDDDDEEDDEDETEEQDDEG